MVKRSLSSSAFSQPAPNVVARVHFSLLQWYQEHQRDLPWRATDDAYAILVSEIMLQQTQVERVLPKYRQFLTAFPTLADLAAAPTADVISVWVPLGYNCGLCACSQSRPRSSPSMRDAFLILTMSCFGSRVMAA